MLKCRIKILLKELNVRWCCSFQTVAVIQMKARNPSKHRPRQWVGALADQSLYDNKPENT